MELSVCVKSGILVTTYQLRLLAWIAPRFFSTSDGSEVWSLFQIGGVKHKTNLFIRGVDLLVEGYEYRFHTNLEREAKPQRIVVQDYSQRLQYPLP